MAPDDDENEGLATPSDAAESLAELGEACATVSGYATGEALEDLKELGYTWFLVLGAGGMSIRIIPPQKKESSNGQCS